MSDYDDTMYALTWHGPEGLLYWSLNKGWIANVEKAWLLFEEDVENIEDDEKLLNNLPQHGERKEGATWEPVSRLHLYDEDNLPTFIRP